MDSIDTRYYGAYLAWGGDYAPFLFRNLWNKLGLQSSFRLRGGVYHVEADYDGVSDISQFETPRSLSLSTSDVAFIGGLVLETRKQIGRRSALSLSSTYEYYSWVPRMRYSDFDAGIMTGPNVGTSIGDDDAFSMRTSLRLTIGLGPRTLFL